MYTSHNNNICMIPKHIYVYVYSKLNYIGFNQGISITINLILHQKNLPLGINLTIFFNLLLRLSKSVK